MILPQTYSAALLVMVLSMLCLGSWANAYKLAGKWRFELFYYDFAIGFVLAAVLYALTVGNLGFDGFKLTDDIFHAGKRQWFFAILVGAVLNLGTMLLVGAISVAGMAVAFPLSMGLALLMGVFVNPLIKQAGSPLYLALGDVLLVAAVLACATAYHSTCVLRVRALAAEGKVKRRTSPGAGKGIILSLVSGLILSLVAPLTGLATTEEIGLGPYALTVLCGVGLVVSTFVYNLFFMNLPLEGEPLEVLDYLKGSLRGHFFGWLGGMVWCTGILAGWVAYLNPVGVPYGVSYALAGGGAVLASLWGLVAWRDFKAGGGMEKGMGWLAVLLFAGGVALVSLAILKGHPA